MIMKSNHTVTTPSLDLTHVSFYEHSFLYSLASQTALSLHKPVNRPTMVSPGSGNGVLQPYSTGSKKQNMNIDYHTHQYGFVCVWCLPEWVFLCWKQNETTKTQFSIHEIPVVEPECPSVHPSFSPSSPSSPWSTNYVLINVGDSDFSMKIWSTRYQPSEC